MKRVFSGIQPTGDLHLGNYFGAIDSWVKLQEDHECIFCIVDYHAITIDYEPKKMQQRILETAAMYLACGIDPKKSIIFVQSDLSEHTELAWIFNTVTAISELERMTQYKDKVKQHKKNINAGLLTYPLLMASDILLYNADLVPVGDDQRQHVELTKTIALKFNKKFGEIFVLPKMYGTKGARIMGLDQPTKKMSKSLGEKNYISLSDTPEVIRKKISHAVTDSGKEILFSDQKPAIANLLCMYQLLTEKSSEDIEKQFADSNYQTFKKTLAETVIHFLEPIQKRYQKLLQDPEKIRSILTEGKVKAQKIAFEHLLKIKRKMGLIF